MDDDTIITVCDNCLQASCWHGEFMCDLAKFAGTTKRKVSELKELKLEDSHHWKKQIDNA